MSAQPLSAPTGLALATLIAALPVGCLWTDDRTSWHYLPNMRYAIPYESFSAHPVFIDGKTLQAPAPGTIARGHLPFPFGPGPDNAARAGEALEPAFPPTPEDLGRGAHLYRVFCAVCHGPSGKGDGPLVARIPPPPAYDAFPVRSYSPGRLMHVVTHGSGRMPAYASQIEVADRWRIVAYVRLLQGAVEPAP